MTKREKALEENRLITCPHCGRAHRAGARFCGRTGKAIAGGEEASPCQPRIYLGKGTSLSESLSAFPLPGSCPGCNHAVTPDTGRFCNNCGYSLGEPPPPPPPKAPEITHKCPYNGCEGSPAPGERYCPKCWKRVRPCPGCGHPSPTGKAACSHCGARMPKDPAQWPMFKGNPQRTGNTRDTIGTSMALRWSYPDKKVAEKILSSPLIHNGIVFFGSFDRHLHALNQYNGSIIWTRPTNGPVVSTPAIRDGVIYMASWDGKIYATDAEKGKPIWVYPRAVSKKAGQVTAPLLACDDGLVAACDDGQVICLQYDTGRLLWRTALDGEEGGDDSSLTVSGPAYSQGKVFVATGKGRLHCLKSSDGGTIWTFPRGKALESRFVSTPAAAASHCYVPDRSGRFYSICENTGEDSWQFTVDLDGVVEGSPSIGFGKVVVGTQTQQLVALNFNSGGEIWRRSNDKIRLIDAIFSTPVITMNRLVFVGSNSGYIYCRELESGDELWKYKLESPIRSSPAVSDGFLYVTTEAGFLHAFTQKK